MFVVTQQPVSNQQVTVRYTTADGPAPGLTLPPNIAPPPRHLQTIPPFTETTLTFPANQGTRRITVTTNDDSTAELTEQLSLRLSSPSANAALATSAATGTLNDNDAPAVSIADASASRRAGYVTSS